jgi:hypothetical protein
MKKFTRLMKIWCFFYVAATFFIISAFLIVDPLEEDSIFLENRLVAHYDVDFAARQIKRYELSVTNSGFCRYKRYYQNGKVEYFAFNFLLYKESDFLGTQTRGLLYLRTGEDDVIVQTYKDPRGDVDSMASYLVIPLKQVEAEDLNSLVLRMLSMRETLQRQQTQLSLRDAKPQ